MLPLVKITNLCVDYGDYRALDNVNLTILSDDFIGVIGPNGGGKTSLIKAILGLIPYSGTVHYAPEVKNGKLHSIGYLPQQNNFDTAFPISVREAVCSGLQSGKKLAGRYTASDLRLADRWLEQVGIARIARKPIGEISGGELQRTLLCRALIADPKVLILDEPANFVDNRFEKELYEILCSLNDRMAIVMVSHDLGTITSVVKTIVCVNRHVHRHNSNVITAEQLHNYDCPIQLIRHGEVPHTVLEKHI